MRVFLGLAAAAIMATPVVWRVDHMPPKPMPCHTEGMVTSFRNQLSICKNGFWKTGPVDSSLLLDQ